MKNLLYFFLIICLFFSCKKDRFEGIIEGELATYIDDFIAEGEKRGVTLSKSKLEAYLLEEFSVEKEEIVCGLGWSDYENNKTQRIEILLREDCWQNRSELARENLIFHELGHALLARDHFNESFPNGSAKSIMCSGTDGACSNFGVYYGNGLLKDYYLDELFNESTPTPAFTQQTNVVSTVFENEAGEGITEWLEFIQGDPNIFEVSIDSSGSLGSGSQNSLTIDIKQSVIDEGSISLVKRFELTDFQACSNLVMKADIRTEGELDGSFGMALSLRERLPNGELNRIFIQNKILNTAQAPTDSFKDLEIEMYCIPTEAEVISVSFSARSKLPFKITADNIRVELVN